MITGTDLRIATLNDARSRINRAAASVARLNRLHGGGREEQVGTGWRLGADLLVMGCYGHGRTREWVLGGATRTVLASMTLPVLMSH